MAYKKSLIKNLLKTKGRHIDWKRTRIEELIINCTCGSWLLFYEDNVNNVIKCIQCGRKYKLRLEKLSLHVEQVMEGSEDA